MEHNANVGNHRQSTASNPPRILSPPSRPMTIASKRCFVTVGSTLFNELVEAATEDVDVLLALRSLQFAEIRVQCGSGRIPPGFGEAIAEDGEESWVGRRCGI